MSSTYIDNPQITPNGDQVLVLLPAELTLDADGLQALIGKFQVELARIRATQRATCPEVTR